MNLSLGRDLMGLVDGVEARLAEFPRVCVSHNPTPLEPLTNLSPDLGASVFVKRDDCTGFAFGGNKVRQLEFYIGAAIHEGADAILITGAIQSNFVRTAAAMARRFGMDCHVQLEERVDGAGDLYRTNGNVLLDRLLGATIHTFPVGEDESGADKSIYRIADGLKAEGRKPYVITLGTDHPPLGALGYVEAALELTRQIEGGPPFDEIIVGSGSASTHSGLLFGLRAIGNTTPVTGICVRRVASLQKPRVEGRIGDIDDLLGTSGTVPKDDVRVFDGSLEPGYGKLNDVTRRAISMTAQREGLFLDPTYTGKVMGGLMMLVESGTLAGKRVLFWHTGGQPGLFAYADQL